MDDRVIAVNTVRSAPHRRNRLLGSLPPADFSLLDAHLKEVELVPRDLLHEAQDELDQVYFPQSGMVSLFSVTDDGDAIETGAVGPEGAIGASAGFGMRRVFSRAIVQVPGIASRIPVSQFQKAARQSDRIRDMIMRNMELLLVQAQQTAACSALHDVDARLARWLLQTQDRTGSATIPLIQESLAQVLGVRRTTINLVVRTLHEAGFINYRRGRVEIVDRDGLKNECCACYHVMRRQLDHLLAGDKK